MESKKAGNPLALGEVVDLVSHVIGLIDGTIYQSRSEVG